MKSILLLAAVKEELDYLVTSLGGRWEKDNTSIFSYKQTRYVAVVTGIGMVNSAAKTAFFLAQEKINCIWMLGCCGSYLATIVPGDIIIATQEINGDLGIGEENWKSPEKLGFPILKTQQREFINCFPCKVPVSLNKIGVYKGPLLSVSTVSGCKNYAIALYKRFDALGENMEGAAVAQIAHWQNIPFIEVRGVSNFAGDRNKTNWSLPLACRNSQKFAMEFFNENNENFKFSSFSMS